MDEPRLTLEPRSSRPTRPLGSTAGSRRASLVGASESPPLRHRREGVGEPSRRVTRTRGWNFSLLLSIDGHAGQSRNRRREGSSQAFFQKSVDGVVRNYTEESVLILPNATL